MKEEMEERERFAEEHARRERETEANDTKQGDEEGARSPRASREVAALQRPNPRVFLDVVVRGPELLGKAGKVEDSGRLEFELFADVVPKTAENFRCLCTGECGKHLHLEDCVFHRIVPGFMAQGGDITDGDGTGGLSIYGRHFPDEAFVKRHEARGVLSMANSGPNTNSSQFFVLFGPAAHLDRKHVVFGRLLQDAGQMLRRMEAHGSKSGDVKGTVRIVRSGQCEQRRNPAPASSRRGRSRSRGFSSSPAAARRRQEPASGTGRRRRARSNSSPRS